MQKRQFVLALTGIVVLMMATAALAANKVPIVAAKRLPDHRQVLIQDAVVTAEQGTLPGSIFVESSNRLAGIRVVTNEEVKEGDRVVLCGRVQTVDGESQIYDVQISGKTEGDPLDPVEVSSRDLDRGVVKQCCCNGRDDSGMLVSYTGKVTGKLPDQSVIYVDDGRGYRDGLAELKGIRVQLPDGTDLSQFSGEVSIVGISRIEKFVIANRGRSLCCSDRRDRREDKVVYAPSIWVLAENSVEPPVDAPGLVVKGPMTLGWDAKLYNYGANLKELQIFQDTVAAGATTAPFYVINSPSMFAQGKVDLTQIFANGATGLGHAVNYNDIPLGATTLTAATYAWPAEGYGVQHTYQARAIVATASGNGNTYSYDATSFGEGVKMTCIEPETADPQHLIAPMNGESVLASDFRSGIVNLTWAAVAGATEYQVTIQPIDPSVGPTWRSNIVIHIGWGVLQMSETDRRAFADYLATAAFVEKDLQWRVDARNSTDTLPLFWTVGEWGTFRVASTPDMPPPPPY